MLQEVVHTSCTGLSTVNVAGSGTHELHWAGNSSTYILGALAKLRITTIGFVMSVRPSVKME